MFVVFVSTAFIVFFMSDNFVFSRLEGCPNRAMALTLTCDFEESRYSYNSTNNQTNTDFKYILFKAWTLAS